MRLALPPVSCKVPTPGDLARAIVTAVGDDEYAKWLEPSHGAGVFIEAIAELGVEKERIIGIDLDPESCPFDNLATVHRRTDFLKWAQKTDQRFARIVGNPPYVSIKRLRPSLRNTASQVLDLDGKAIGFSANVWYAFVLCSIRLLEPGGTLAFVLPSSAEFADYSSLLREKIGDLFSSVELHRSKTSLFDDVQDGTVVAIARDYRSNKPTGVRKKMYDGKDSLIKGVEGSNRPRGRRCPKSIPPRSTLKTKLASIATIRLGGVTGDASYFLMNEKRRISLDLPTAALTPVLSKAKHLKGALITSSDWNNLKANDERVWLFNPDCESVADPMVQRYLELLPNEGGCRKDAYKIAIREPWYRTPLPLTPDAFLSGMNQKGPWLCINEIGEDINATNTLYAVRFNSREKSEWYMWALALLTSEAQTQIRRIGRHYTDGLVKYEPGSIGQINLPKIKIDEDHKTLYLKAMDAFFSSDLKTAKEIANTVRI